MKIMVMMERSVTDAIELEIDSLEQLEEIMKDSNLLNEIRQEQHEEWEEDDDNNEYILENNKLIKVIR